MSLKRNNSDELNEDIDIEFKCSLPTLSNSKSLYYRFNTQRRILKWTGTFIMLVMTAATLAITEISYKKGIDLEPDCIKLQHSEQIHKYNHSLCDFIKQFEIPDTYYVTICLYQDEIIVDIRQFINGKETIKGVQINTRQWKYIQQIIPYINKTIEEAQNQKIMRDSIL